MTTQTIDDQDNSHVTYVGHWVLGGTPSEYAGTVVSSTILLPSHSKVA